MTEPVNVFTPPREPPVNTAPAVPRRVEGTTPTPSTSQADLSPQERWQADQAEADRRDPWRDPNVVLTRDEKTGAIIARDRTTGKPIEEEAGPAVEGDAAPPADGQKRVKIGDMELSEAEWQAIAAHKAESDLRKAQVPAKPGEYKLELPKDLKLPEGMIWEIAKDNDPVKGPAIQAARDWAHRNGLSQPQFSELLGLYAASQANEQIKMHNIARAEAQKLGVTGPARMDAIGLFLRGHYGDAAARPILLSLATEAQVRIWEDVIHKLTSQGGASFSARGREGELNTTVDDATWNKMTYSEQKSYAEAATARAQSGGRR